MGQPWVCPELELGPGAALIGKSTPRSVPEIKSSQWVNLAQALLRPVISSLLAK